MGIQDCVYDLTTKKRGSGKTLGMGEACQFCRSVRTDMHHGKPADIRAPPLRDPTRIKKKVSGQPPPPSPGLRIDSTFDPGAEM